MAGGKRSDSTIARATFQQDDLHGGAAAERLLADPGLLSTISYIDVEELSAPQDAGPPSLAFLSEDGRSALLALQRLARPVRRQIFSTVEPAASHRALRELRLHGWLSEFAALALSRGVRTVHLRSAVAPGPLRHMLSGLSAPLTVMPTDVGARC